MRIKKLADARDGGDTLTLGVQTNPEDLLADSISKGNAWAPRLAKSFTIIESQNTNYHGHHVVQITGYATIKVAYFTTVKEGKHQVIKKKRAV